MLETTIFYSSLSLLFIIFTSIFFFQTKSKYKNLPPSPLSIPIIGHIHLLKEPLIHRTLHNLSQKLGDVFSLRFGSKLVVVVSSPSAVEECFHKNDIIFANRPKMIAGKHFGYGYSTVVNAPYGEHWRNLRRVSTLEIFSSSRLNTFMSIRKDEVKHLLKKMSHNSRQHFAKVQLRPLLTELTLNNIMRMVTGKRYNVSDDISNDGEAENFKELIAEIMENGGVSSPSDFFPVLRWIDYGNFEKKISMLAERMDKFLQGLIEEHRTKKEGSETTKNTTMIDHLLSLQESEPEYYTDEIIKGLVVILKKVRFMLDSIYRHGRAGIGGQVMLLAGTDTSAVTLEWAMSNLLNNPDILKKAKEELDTQLGEEHLIDEPDVPKLQYLQGIISETLRLYPAAPLLVPHMSSGESTIGGYDVPRGTMLLVNAWAIQRDPKHWEEATSFKPERFVNQEYENHKLMPFGIGRRACPGVGLAQRVVGLTLGSMIQCFEWKRISDKEIDMAEGKGLTMPKFEPLEAMCKARPIMNQILNEAN